MMKKFCLLFCFFPLICFSQNKTSFAVYSPNKLTVFNLHVKNARLQYSVSNKGKLLLAPSILGLTIDGIELGEDASVKTQAQSAFDKTFEWPLGEDDKIRNHYVQAIFSCVSKELPFKIVVRVYDGAVAFRYQLDEKGAHRISREKTSFHLSKSYELYQYHRESEFRPMQLDTFSVSSDLPLTLTDNADFISIGEADNGNYTKAELKKGAELYTLQTTFPIDSMVEMNGPFSTPWRTIAFASSAIGLHDFSQLYIRLVEPTGAIPNWIRPGKLIRSQLNTQSGIDCIDFAAAHQFQYIMFDAGWYGAEFRTTSDPTLVIPEIDMSKVIAYGKSKQIGVILYVNYVGLRAKLDTILPLFKEWGVAGIKFGFVDALTQNGIEWLTGAIKKTNDFGFILDIHDNYKPTGLNRKYPALLTQEGIRGDENSPDAFHTTVLPFTRFLAGPADFTFCYPNKTNDYSKNIKVSKAQQLALTVVYFSPLQSIFWYGKPKEYTDEQEIEFFKYVPTVWNESHYLLGSIGKYISVVRRHGGEWYMGNIAGPEDWNASLRLDFLKAGVNYTASIYSDDGVGGIVKQSVHCKKGDAFAIKIRAKGGQAVIFRPAPLE